MTTFSATVDKWILESEDRIEAVFKTAIQDTVDEVLDRTPVDTGFLKSSLQASKTGFAPLRSKGSALPDTAISLVIANIEIGETFFANFTANYAVYVENGARGRAGRGMVKLAAQNWQQNVNRAVGLLRS